MTISSTTRKAGPFDGNDVTVAFPFTFKVFEETDLVVVATDASDVETTKTLTTHYTVSLNADQDASPGGTVTMLTAPATGTLLTITSAVPELQAVALTNMGGFYPAVINNALDRLTILIQQVAEETDRAVKVAVSSTTDPDDLLDSITASAAAAAASAAAAAGSAAAAASAIPSGTLGYTPVNIAGDTMTGNLLVPGINVNGSGLITSLGNVVTKTHGTASGNVPLVGAKSATTVLAGLVEQSTSAENVAGTDDTVFPSVLGVREAFNATGTAPVYACRAWVNFNGTGTVAIRASGNVSSITDNGTGDYTINFTTALPDADYAAALTASSSSGGDSESVHAAVKGTVAPTASALRMIVTTGWAVGTVGAQVKDAPYVNAAIFR